MRIGLNMGFLKKFGVAPVELVNQAEALGYDSVWVGEAYGSDAVSIAAWLLSRSKRIRVGTAIMQMSARTPATTAMTAMTLAELSGNRFIVGLGASGPQVVEGWHGVPYGKPVTRLREYVQIMRMIMARQGPVSFDGEVYQLPCRGEGTTGLGKPLKSTLKPAPAIPIYSASFTPGGIAASAEIADGVCPTWLNPDRYDLIGQHLDRGFSRRTDGKTAADFDVMPSVPVAIGEDLEACRQPIKAYLALYIGGMGARDKNFYNRYARESGYEEAAIRIQDLYLAGDKAAAAAAVPDELVDEISLVGPLGRIAERAEAWKALGRDGRIGTLQLNLQQPEYLSALADILCD